MEKRFEIEYPEPSEAPGEAITMTLGGALDAESVAQWEAATEKILASRRICVILDLERLRFISSAGISAVMVFVRKLKALEGELAIVKPNEKIARVLGTVGVDKIVPMEEPRPGR